MFVFHFLDKRTVCVCVSCKTDHKKIIVNLCVFVLFVFSIFYRMCFATNCLEFNPIVHLFHRFTRAAGDSSGLSVWSAGLLTRVLKQIFCPPPLPLKNTFL